MRKPISIVLIISLICSSMILGRIGKAEATKLVVPGHGILFSGFRVDRSIAAVGTIYIRADGSIDPPTAPIFTLDSVTYTFSGDIYGSIIVEREDMIIDGDGYILRGTGDPWGFEVGSYGAETHRNVTIRNTSIQNFTWGIFLVSCSECNIWGNNISANTHLGIELGYSSGCNISGNNIATNGDSGILLGASSNNSISRNNMTANAIRGIFVYYSDCNVISENNMTANIASAIYLDSSSGNNISANNITANGDGIESISSNDNNISENSIRANIGPGILLSSSSGSIISRNDIAANTHGTGIVLFSSSNNNTISRNNIADNAGGFELTSYSDDNVIFANNITSNDGYSVWLSDSPSGNRFFHNNFVNNTVHLYSSPSGSINKWDDGYPSGGNYWSDYSGTDQFRGSHQNVTGSDGKGDTAFTLNANNVDHFPLMVPYNSPLIIGDLNNDRKVNILDIIIVALQFGRPPPPITDLRADVNGDGTVNVLDIVIASIHFGEAA